MPLEPAQIIMGLGQGVPTPIDVYALAEQIKHHRADEVIRQAQEQRRASLYTQEQGARTAEQSYLAGQMQPIIAEDTLAPAQQQFNDPQVWDQAMGRFQQQAQQFGQMDPRLMEQEVQRQRQRQSLDRTYDWARRAGMTVHDIGGAHQEGYMDYLSRNGYNPTTGELNPMATLGDSTMTDFYSQDPSRMGPAVADISRRAGHVVQPTPGLVFPHQQRGNVTGEMLMQANPGLYPDPGTANAAAQLINTGRSVGGALPRANARAKGALVPYESREELLADFPNLATVADSMLTRYNKGAITFNDLQQENGRRGSIRSYKKTPEFDRLTRDMNDAHEGLARSEREYDQALDKAAEQPGNTLLENRIKLLHHMRNAASIKYDEAKGAIDRYGQSHGTPTPGDVPRGTSPASDTNRPILDTTQPFSGTVPGNPDTMPPLGPGMQLDDMGQPMGMPPPASPAPPLPQIPQTPEMAHLKMTVDAARDQAYREGLTDPMAVKARIRQLIQGR